MPTEKARQGGKITPSITDKDFDPFDCYFVEVQQSSPDVIAKSAWGLVNPMDTGGRDSPPKLKCFDTENTWFDRGHLIALQLGGSDILENLVPQVRSQNQHLRWREIESKVAFEAQEGWRKEKAYYYYGVTAEYRDASGDGAIIPEALLVTVLKLTPKPKMPVLQDKGSNPPPKTPPPPPPPSVDLTKDFVKGMAPALAFAEAKKLTGYTVSTFINQERVSNAVNGHDIFLAIEDLRKPNEDHLFAYFAGELMTPLTGSQRTQVMMKYDSSFMSDSGLSRKGKLTLQSWLKCYQAVKDSGLLDADATRKKLDLLYASDGTASSAEASAIDITKSKKNWVAENTIQSKRRRESLDGKNYPSAQFNYFRLEQLVKEITGDKAMEDDKGGKRPLTGSDPNTDAKQKKVA